MAAAGGVSPARRQTGVSLALAPDPRARNRPRCGRAAGRRARSVRPAPASIAAATPRSPPDAADRPRRSGHGNALAAPGMAVPGDLADHHFGRRSPRARSRRAAQRPAFPAHAQAAGAHGVSPGAGSAPAPLRGANSAARRSASSMSVWSSRAERSKRRRSWPPARPARRRGSTI